MAKEIGEIGSELPPYESRRMHADDLKNDNTISLAEAVDLEESLDDENKSAPRDRAEATELTPAEAFKWNVEGDQSPCWFFRISTLEV